MEDSKGHQDACPQEQQAQDGTPLPDSQVTGSPGKTQLNTGTRWNNRLGTQK